MKRFPALIRALGLNESEQEYFIALVNDQLEDAENVREDWANKGVAYRVQEYMGKVVERYNYSRDHRRLPKGRRFSLDFFISDQSLYLDDTKKKIALERANFSKTTK